MVADNIVVVHLFVRVVFGSMLGCSFYWGNVCHPFTHMP
jgi:hypothetical protein